MRIQRLTLVFLLVLASRGIAQTPSDGKIVGDSYVNSYFKFSYTWPSMLKPYDTKSLNLPQSSPSANEFMLFSARQGDEPYGVVVLAVRLNAVTPRSRGIRDGSDLIDRVEKFSPEQHAVVVSRKHFTNAAGLVFDQLDYTDNGVASSAIAAEIGKFLIVVKCNAQSAPDLAEMDRAAAELRLTKQ